MPPRAMFTSRCIRVNKIEKPLKSRCGKELDPNGNGLLCKKCLADARQGKIPVLMSADVEKIFNIEFKNQVYVWVDLSGGSNKMNGKDKFRLRIINSLNDMNLKELQNFYEKLFTDFPKLRKKSGDIIELRRDMTTFITNKLIAEGK